MVEPKRRLAWLVNRRPRIIEKKNLPTLSFKDIDLMIVNRLDWSVSRVEEAWR